MSGISFECDRLIDRLRRIQSKDTAADVVRQLVSRGLNIAKPLAQATKPDLGAAIVTDPIQTDGAVAQGGFSVHHQLAPFFEFGTGLPGNRGEVANGAPRNPAAAGFGYTLQTVILSGPRAGQIRPGWVYFRDGRFFHTLGQPAKPFMYPAQEALEKEAAQIAGVTVKDNIGR